MSTPRIDLSGLRFGRLTVSHEWTIRLSSSGEPRFFWLCACDCGSQKFVHGEMLRKGRTRSCGCLHKDGLIARNKAGAGIAQVPERAPRIRKPKLKGPRKLRWHRPRITGWRGINSKRHGGAGKDYRTWKPEYRAWVSMKARCSNYPNRQDYKDYYARGIRVCELWQKSFEAFLSHIGPKPSPRHSVDRINNDGNYEPGNVRWATSSQQVANQRPRSYRKDRA